MASCLMASTSAFGQTEMTAGVVMERMEADERYTYVAGIIEGLAYARYARDGRDVAGMECIYGWFYGQEGAVEQIYAAFQEFPEYLPGAVLSVLLNQVCE